MSNSNYQILQRIFKRRSQVKSEDEDLLSVGRGISDGPHEQLFLPSSIRVDNADVENMDDPLELLGIPYRVDITETQDLELQELPEGLSCLTYDSKQFKIGLSDGLQGIPQENNLNNLQNILDIEKSLTYPLRIHEQNAFYEGKKQDYEQQLELKEEKVKTAKKLKEESTNEVKILVQHKEELIVSNRKNIVDSKRESQERLKEETSLKTAELAQADARTDAPNGFAQFITGLFLTCSGVIFILADVALSITAIYALGFKDIDNANLKWGEAVFDISTWGRNWEGVFICFGIAAITFFFKYIYEHVSYSSKPFPKKKLWFVGSVFVLCLGTVMVLGMIRADYVVSNIVNHKSNIELLKWGMFLTTILFPLLGAVLLAEGLSRTFKTLGQFFKTLSRLIQTGARMLIKPWKKEDDNNLGAEVTSLSEKIKKVELLEQEYDEQESDGEREIIELKGKISRIALYLPVWENALAEYEKRWDRIPELERKYYIHGYEQGMILRKKEGMYAAVLEKVSEQILLSPSSRGTLAVAGNRIDSKG